MDIEWLMLADSAQVVGNKLYLLGGGWDRLTVPQLPSQHACSIAMSALVPWAEANQPQTFEIEVATEDGRRLSSASGSFEVGRPANVTPGQEQRFQLAATMNLQLEREGAYAIVARVQGKERRRVWFHVAHRTDGGQGADRAG